MRSLRFVLLVLTVSAAACGKGKDSDCNGPDCKNSCSGPECDPGSGDTDATKLATPEGLRASASRGCVVLSWDAVAGADSYELLMNGSSYGTSLATALGNPPSLESCVLPAEQCATFSIVARGVGHSESDPASVYACTGPAVSVLEVPTSFSATARAPNKVWLTWAPAMGAESYELERQPLSGAATVIPVAGSQHLDLLPTPGPYTYRVRSKAGTRLSNFSNAAWLDTSTTPSDVPAATVTWQRNTGPGRFGVVEVSWQAVSYVSLYRVFRDTDAAGSFATRQDTSNTSFVDYDTELGTTYYYKVSTIQNDVPVETSSVVSITTAPPAPAEPAYSNLTYSSVRLTWPAVSSASSYDLYSSTDDVSFVRIAQDVAATSYDADLSGFAQNDVVFFRLVAKNTSGEGPPGVSGPVVVPFALAAPQDLVATTNLLDEVQLTWSAVTGAHHYVVYRNGTAVSGELTTTQYTDHPALESNFTYTVRAVTADDTEGPSSSGATGRALRISAPTGFTYGTLTASTLSFTWTTHADAASYSIYRGTAVGGPYAKANASALTTTSYTETPPLEGTTYYYRLVAVSDGGNESAFASTILSGQVTHGVATPQGVTASDGVQQQIDVSWNSVAAADTYAVLRAVDSPVTFVEVASGLTSSSYTDTSVSSDVTYYYRVVAAQADGDSSQESAYDAGWAQWAFPYVAGSFALDFTGSGLGASFTTPTSLAIDSAERLLIVEAGSSSLLGVYRFRGYGTGDFLDRVGAFGDNDGQFNPPFGVAVGASDSFFVSDIHTLSTDVTPPLTHRDRVQRFNDTGVWQANLGSGHGSGAGELDQPRGLAVDSGGNVFVVDSANSRIVKFSSAGAYVTAWGTAGTADGQLSGASNLAIDSNDDVWVADTNNDRVQKFSSTGTHLLTVPTGSLTRPQSVAVGPGNSSGSVERVFVGDGATGAGRDRVRVFSLSGALVKTLGRGGQVTAAIWGLAVNSGGQVFVLDNTKTVKIFSPSE